MKRRIRLRKESGGLPLDLDVDRLNHALLNAVQKAARKWKENPPNEETVFLSRLLENIRRPWGGCDVGLKNPMYVVSEVYNLHRKGEKKTDQFGADLAVTLRIGKTWTKTAIFQLKKSNEYKLELDADDLKAADEDERIAERSFVLSVDEGRLGIRLQKIEQLKQIYEESPAKSQTFHTSRWLALTDWFREWLQCKQAPASSPTDPNAVETLLEAFRLGPLKPDSDFDYEPGEGDHLRYVPARQWLQTSIQSPE